MKKLELLHVEDADCCEWTGCYFHREACDFILRFAKSRGLSPDDTIGSGISLRKMVDGRYPATVYGKEGTLFLWTSRNNTGLRRGLFVFNDDQDAMTDAAEKMELRQPWL